MKESIFGLFIEVYKKTFEVLRARPVISILFLVVAFFDLCALTVLFFAPSKPLSSVLAPIIRSFWGERFLHYPDNFILLPKLFSHAHFVVVTFIGIFVTGLVIKKIQSYEEDRTGLGDTLAVRAVVRKMIPLLLIWWGTYALFNFVVESTMTALPRIVAVQLSVGFLLGLVLQSLFAFMMPVILLSSNGVFRSLIEGVVFGMKYLPRTALIIAIPILGMSVISFLKALTPVYVQFWPELVLWVLFLSVLVTFIVDMFITTSVTLLYLRAAKTKELV